MSNNTFEKLAELGLFVCETPASPPNQWIYAVDDAWCHYGCAASEMNQALQPLFSALCNATIEQKGTKNTWALSNAIKAVAPPANEAKGEEVPLADGGTGDSPADAKPHPDAPIARKLLEFIQVSSGKYGICFCSFEYFWTHIKEINRSENAVLFDIRHQLSDTDSNAGLADEWNRAFKTYWEVNPKTSDGGQLRDAPFNFDKDRLGFHLYFSLKLGWIPGAPKNKIDDNHLLILSSNLFETADTGSATTLKELSNIVSLLQESKAISEGQKSALSEFIKSQQRESAFQSFLVVQKEVWDRISIIGTGKKRGLDFTMIPVPKGLDGGLLDTGLKILDNTFKNAANYEAKKSALRHDMSLSWSESKYDWGHYQPEDAGFQHQSAPLHSIAWLLGDGAEQQAALRALYYSAWKPDEKASSISVRSFAEFLKYHCEPQSVDFDEFQESNNSVSRISLPTCPGILLALGMVEFLRELATPKEDDAKRVKPKVNWARNDSTVTMAITLGSSDKGVAELKQKFFGRVSGGSVRALNSLVNAQIELLYKDYGGIQIGDIVGAGDKTLRDKLLEDAAGQAVRQARTAPSFDDKEIRFYFCAF